MATEMTQIKDALLSEIAIELGVSYKQLAYVEDIAKNSFRTSNDRYGVRSLTSTETDSVSKYATFSQSFEVVLIKGYIQSAIDDTEQVSKSYELRESAYNIYVNAVKNKIALPSVVMRVSNFQVAEPEYLEDDKVVIVRCTMDILYRLTLL